MRKKESKIPLVLTFLILGYFIFWAFGYVSRNQPARAQAPIVTPQRQALVEIDRPQSAPVQAAAAPPSPTPDMPQQRVVAQPMAAGTANATDDASEVEFEDKPNGNRKILGVLRETTGKH